MKIMRFTSAVSCGILRPSQRAFGTYLCVYRKEDDHTAPDRKSSGWMILSAMWLRRTMFPSRRVGRGRQILSFPSSCRPGQKVRRCEWSRSDALFCMHSFVYSPVCLPVIYIFTAYHPLIFTLVCILLPHRIQLFFPHISCPSTAASIVSSCAGPPIPPALPPPYSQRPRSSFASYVPSLAPLYLQLPPPRPLSGMYAASESLPFERSFRLLYCFANGLPLPVDSDCIQCLMYEKLSCFR